MPTVSIDKTDGCQVYLNKDTLDVDIVTAKSSEMNILIPNSEGEFVSVNAKIPLPTVCLSLLLDLLHTFPQRVPFHTVFPKCFLL